jgi:hypothetical protein
MMWTLNEAQVFCQQLEKIALAYGWNVLLGGGVLIRGYSNKDLDIYLLARNRSRINRIDCINYIKTLGFEEIKHMRFPDRDTYVMLSISGSRRLDVTVLIPRIGKDDPTYNE